MADNELFGISEQLNDTISRQAAIVAVCKSECESGYCGIPCPEVNAHKALPPAQPETHDKRTGTRACDCISRQEAIDAEDSK